MISLGDNSHRKAAEKWKMEIAKYQWIYLEVSKVGGLLKCSPHLVATSTQYVNFQTGHFRLEGGRFEQNCLEQHL